MLDFVYKTNISRDVNMYITICLNAEIVHICIFKRNNYTYIYILCKNTDEITALYHVRSITSCYIRQYQQTFPSYYIHKVSFWISVEPLRQFVQHQLSVRREPLSVVLNCWLCCLKRRLPQTLLTDWLTDTYQSKVWIWQFQPAESLEYLFAHIVVSGQISEWSRAFCYCLLLQSTRRRKKSKLL